MAEQQIIPRVSVIIPVYNAEKYLRECLDSVVNQTLKDIEIICVNDGSTDNSLQILEEYASQDSRIRIINQENQGAGSARNKGLEIAKGEYLSFLDADDYFEPNMFEIMYERSKTNDLDIVIANSRQFDNINKKTYEAEWQIKAQLLPDKNIFNVYDIPKYIFNFSIGWCWDKLFRNEFIKENNLKFQNITSTNDTYFVFSAMFLAKKISTIDNVLITKRCFVENNLSGINSHNKDPLCFLEAFYELKNKLIETNMYTLCEQSLLNFLAHLFLWHLTTLNKSNQKLLKKEFKTKVYKYFNFNQKNADYFYNKTEFSKFQILFPDLFLYKNFIQKIISAKTTCDEKYKIITVLGIRIKVRREDNMIKKFLRNIFSVKNQNIHKVVTILGLRIKFKNYKKLNYCPICNQYGIFKDFGLVVRISAKCPYCGSLERHRFLYFIYKKYFLNTKRQIKLLHTAPEKCLYQLISKNKNIDYITTDLSPERYKFCNCLKEDVTNLSFADNTFDVIISNHVMEHILDDSLYLNELLRVLKPDGELFISFPVDMKLEKTFQDDSIVTPEDREKYYGQYDHVRKYGRDIFDKLKNKYNAKVIFVYELMNHKQIKKYSLLKNEFVAIIQKERNK